MSDLLEERTHTWHRLPRHLHVLIKSPSLWRFTAAIEEVGRAIAKGHQVFFASSSVIGNAMIFPFLG